LSAEWHLDSVDAQSGGTPDSSGYGNHGVVSAADLGPGRFAQGLTFTSQPRASSEVVVPASQSLEPSTVTVLAWVRAAQSPGSLRYVVSKGAMACTAASYALYTGGGGGLQFYLYDGNQTWLSPAVAPGSVWDGNWHGVAGVFDGSAVRLYVDGHEVGSGTPFGGQIAYAVSDRRLVLGHYTNQFCPFPTQFDGGADEVRVYHRALSPAELNYLLTNGDPDPPELPIPGLSGPPVNTSPPALSGSPVEGEAMFCSVGTWNGARPLTYTHGWLRDGHPIAAAASSSYIVAAADVSHTLSCRITAMNSVGMASAASPGLFMTPTPPRNRVPPAINATSRKVGSTLACSPGQWTGAPTTYSYQWFRGTSAIAGATHATYRTVDDDTYQGIICLVAAHGPGGTGYAQSEPIIPQPATPISVKYYSLGGPQSFLGRPRRVEKVGPRGGRYRDYQGGSIYWSRRTGAHVIFGAIRAEWLAVGGAAVVGYPSTDERTVATVGRYNEFYGGASIFWSPRTGAHEVYGAIREHWYKIGAVYGVTGFPVSDELPTGVRNGRRSEFEHASIYWSPASGAHEVHGAIRQAWGRNLPFWGYPITDETPTYYGAAGDYNDFEHGSIHWSARNGIEAWTRCPHWACHAGDLRARTRCSRSEILNELRLAEDARLSAFDRAFGEVGTLLKRSHIVAKGWASRACFVHNAVGVMVRSPQWSTDGIWTLDLRLEQFVVEGTSVAGLRTRFLRLEVEFRNGHNSGYAHHEVDRYGPFGTKFGCIINVPLPLCGNLPLKLYRGSNLPAGTHVRFGGLVVLDSDHGILEVHPDSEFYIYK
jgi:hypothetical protein